MYQYIIDNAPKTSAKRVVKASLLALSDPAIRDRDVLEAVYALAISYRLSSLGVEDDPEKVDDEDVHPPKLSGKLMAKLEGSASEMAMQPDSKPESSI